MIKKILPIILTTIVMCTTAGCSNTQVKEEDIVEKKEDYQVIDYANVFFEENIPQEIKSEKYTTPNEDIAKKIKQETGISVYDSSGATGVELVPSIDDNNTTDFYLNTFVANSELVVSVENGTDVKVSNNNTNGTIDNIEGENNLFKVNMEPISLKGESEETINITIDGKTYIIHTKNEMLPNLTSYSDGDADKGVYTFALDKFLLRVNTEEELIYYRDMGCVCKNTGKELFVENFKAEDTDDGRYYSVFVEIDASKRNSRGGYSSGQYVIMDENYVEINYATLQPNDDPNHTHGEGYLDHHEFLMLGKDHWLTVSYTPLKVDTLPSSLGVEEAYVHAGIIQEVKDGKVVNEYNTTDYPMLYTTAKEFADYAESRPDGAVEDYMDYVHINSIYVDPKDNNLIVSMRSQYSVYKIDRETGEIIWILGGDADQFGLTEEQKFVGQHYAVYVDKNYTNGNDSTITIFDNHTDFKENKSRVLEITLNEAEKSIVNYTEFVGKDMDELSAKLGKDEANHWATHCGSSEIQSQESLIIGWGLHSNLSGDGNIPILSDYNKVDNKMNFELYSTRNEKSLYEDKFFSYRIYKNTF